LLLSESPGWLVITLQFLRRGERERPKVEMESDMEKERERDRKRKDERDKA